MKSLRVIMLACLVVLVSSASLTRIMRPVEKRKASTSVPITFIYINGITGYYGADLVPTALGVPGFTAGNVYNYVAHTFWTFPNNPLSASSIWSDIYNHMKGVYPYGNSTADIQATLKQNFTNAGVKLLVSAFGATQMPTSAGIDPIECALQIANFVNNNNYDGVDIDWEDTDSFLQGDGSGEDWLITLTTVLRRNLKPGAIITHAPQAPYFGIGKYPMGAYLAVNQEVGSMIDFYNIQFYNQGKGMYEDPQGLFNVSGSIFPGTSVNEIIARGIPASKVVLGKPAVSKDAHNGLIDAATLNQAIIDNYAYNGWNTGLMYWQYIHDLDGAICAQAGAGVITMLPEEKNNEYVARQ